MSESADLKPITVDLDALGLGPEDPAEQKAAAESIYRARKSRLRGALETVTTARAQALTALSVLGAMGTIGGPVEPLADSSTRDDEPGPGDAVSGFSEPRSDEPDAVVTKSRSDEPDAVVTKPRSDEARGG